MFCIHYKKPFVACLLGIQKPKRVRIKTFKNDFGQIEYMPQANWVGDTWSDNLYSTPKVKALMWSLYGPKGKHGTKMEEIEIVGVPVDKNILNRQKIKLDYFPFDPPK